MLLHSSKWPKDYPRPGGPRGYKINNVDSQAPVFRHSRKQLDKVEKDIWKAFLTMRNAMSKTCKWKDYCFHRTLYAHLEWAVLRWRCHVLALRDWNQDFARDRNQDLALWCRNQDLALRYRKLVLATLDLRLLWTNWTKKHIRHSDWMLLPGKHRKVNVALTIFERLPVDTVCTAAFSEKDKQKRGC